jgi:hypothetical protein
VAKSPANPVPVEAEPPAPVPKPPTPDVVSSTTLPPQEAITIEGSTIHAKKILIVAPLLPQAIDSRALRSLGPR